MRRVLSMGLIGAGTGAGIGSLAHVRDFLTRKSPIPANRRLGVPRPVMIQAGPPTVDEEEERRRELMAKTANRPADPLADPAAAAEIPPMEGDHGLLARGARSIPHVVGGSWTANHFSKPWFLPAAIGATGLGLYGGYKGVRGILNSRRKADREAELLQAKKEYRDALVDQYTAGSKTAGAADDLAHDLEELSQEKAAGGLADVGGTTLGAYLAAAGLLAAGAGAATYSYTKSQAPESRLAKAIEQRERLRWTTRPPEIYAVSRAKQPQALKAEEDEQELAGKTPVPTSKLAELYRRAPR